MDFEFIMRLLVIALSDASEFSQISGVAKRGVIHAQYEQSRFSWSPD